jgi:hypothetical protein
MGSTYMVGKVGRYSVHTVLYICDAVLLVARSTRCKVKCLPSAVPGPKAICSPFPLSWVTSISVGSQISETANHPTCYWYQLPCSARLVGQTRGTLEPKATSYPIFFSSVKTNAVNRFTHSLRILLSTVPRKYESNYSVLRTPCLAQLKIPSLQELASWQNSESAGQLPVWTSYSCVRPSYQRNANYDLDLERAKLSPWLDWGQWGCIAHVHTSLAYSFLPDIAI